MRNRMVVSGALALTLAGGCAHRDVELSLANPNGEVVTGKGTYTHVPKEDTARLYAAIEVTTEGPSECKQIPSEPFTEKTRAVMLGMQINTYGHISDFFVPVAVLKQDNTACETNLKRLLLTPWFPVSDQLSANPAYISYDKRYSEDTKVDVEAIADMLRGLSVGLGAAGIVTGGAGTALAIKTAGMAQGLESNRDDVDRYVNHYTKKNGKSLISLSPPLLARNQSDDIEGRSFTFNLTDKYCKSNACKPEETTANTYKVHVNTLFHTSFLVPDSNVRMEGGQRKIDASGVSYSAIKNKPVITGMDNAGNPKTQTLSEIIGSETHTNFAVSAQKENLKDVCTAIWQQLDKPASPGDQEPPLSLLDRSIYLYKFLDQNSKIFREIIAAGTSTSAKIRQTDEKLRAIDAKPNAAALNEIKADYKNIVQTHGQYPDVDFGTTNSHCFNTKSASLLNGANLYLPTSQEREELRTVLHKIRDLKKTPKPLETVLSNIADKIPLKNIDDLANWFNADQTDPPTEKHREWAAQVSSIGAARAGCFIETANGDWQIYAMSNNKKHRIILQFDTSNRVILMEIREPESKDTIETLLKNFDNDKKCVKSKLKDDLLT